jgi:hypothetical protein
VLVAPVADVVDLTFVVTVWLLGLLTIPIFGGAGGVNGAVTVTAAWSVALTLDPVGGLPVAVATLVNAAVTPERLQLKLFDCPTPSVPRLRSQSGESGSVTVTSLRVTSPVFVTVILKFAVPPVSNDWVFGSFTIEIAGWVTTAAGGGGGGTVTVTGAESVAVTVCPFEPVPVAVATFVKAAVTLDSEQLYVTLAPGAIEARAEIDVLVWLQFGESGSLTVTFESVSVPVLVTTIVKFAVDPLAIV